MQVRFKKLTHSPESVYSTENPLVQKALEAKSYYGTTFTCINEVVDEPVTPAPVEEVKIKEYPEVVRLAEAKKILVELGVDESKIKTKKDICAYSEGMRIAFPNLKR